MINTIIFDFDGTLVNTNDVIIEAWQHTYRHYGRDEKPVDYITQFFGEPLITTHGKRISGSSAGRKRPKYTGLTRGPRR